jgi:predicted ATPase
MTEIHVPKIRQLNVRIEGRDVVVLEAGQAVLILPWDAALALANTIRMQARRIEEHVKANGVIADQALLMRAGIPIGLSTNPEIMKAAAKEAAWNTELRRAIPSIKSAEKFGVPTLKQEKPK